MNSFKRGGKYYKSNLHVALVVTEFIIGVVGVYGALVALMAL